MKANYQAVKERIQANLRAQGINPDASYNIYDSKLSKTPRRCKPARNSSRAEPFTLAKKFIHLHLYGGGNLTIARQDFQCAEDRDEGFTNVFVKEREEPYVVRESQHEVYDSYFRTGRYQNV